MSSNEAKRYAEMVVSPALSSLKSILMRKKMSQDDISFILNEKEQLWVAKETLIANRLSVPLTTRCTLTCTHCNNLMPLYHKRGEHYDADPEEIINYLEIVLDSLDECVRLDLIGGEPFLYKPLGRIIKAFAAHPKITQIEMITNGTVVPVDSLLNTLKQSNVLVSISDYGNITKLANLVDIFERNDISFEILANIQWVEGTVPQNNERTTQELIEQYLNCSSAKYCKTLFKDRIYPCPRAAHLTDLGYMDNVAEYLQICKSKQFKEELREFFIGTYTGACRYCYAGLTNVKTVPAAEQENGKHHCSSYMLVSREEYIELRKYLTELARGKDWLETQYFNYKKLYEEGIKK